MLLTAGRYGLSIERRRGGLAIEFRSNVSDPDRWLVEYAGGHPTSSGQVMTERTAVQLSAVYCAVTLISDALGLAPLCLYKKLDPEGREEAKDHPLYSLLRNQPNEEMTAATFRTTQAGHLLLWGNCYAEIERNGAGQPVALWPLRPDRTFPRRLNDKRGKPTGKLVYVARSSAGQEVILQPEDVLHTMGYSYDGLRGLSPIALHRETLGLSMATTDYGARFFGNDARPGGVLQTPGKLKKEAAERLKASWEEAHRSGAQAYRVAVLEEGIEWKAIGMPNEDAQFLETRVFQLSEIARIFHVPLHMLSELSRATFSNIEHQAIEFIKFAVLPWAERFEQEIERKLLSTADQMQYYVEHNLDAQMRGDLKSRYEAYDIAWKNGWLNADEIGELENWNPQKDETGQKYWVPVSQQPVDLALKPPEPPPPVPAFPPAKGKGNPPPPPPPPKPKRSGTLECLINAYVPILLTIGERLARKETQSIPRAATKDTLAALFEEHLEYVRGAVTGPLAALEESVSELFSHWERRTLRDRDAFVKGYVARFAERHVTQLRTHAQEPGQPVHLELWKQSVPARARTEARRGVNAFALALYKAAGLKVVWVTPDDLCCARCLALAERGAVEAGTDFEIGITHPPLHPECQCQIVMVDGHADLSAATSG